MMEIMKQFFLLELKVSHLHYEQFYLDAIDCVPDGWVENEHPGYVEVQLSARSSAHCKELSEKFGSFICSITEHYEQNWMQKWAESVQPVELCDGIFCSPEWLPPPPGHRHWIKIEPKMAFGTGHHESTRIAANLLINNISSQKNAHVLDIGTGSGILCFAALIRGAILATGLEIDPICAEYLAENRDLNHKQAQKATFFIGPLEALKQTVQYNLIVINIVLNQARPLLKQAIAHLQADGLLIWSGLTTEQKPQVVDILQQSGFNLISEKSENQWWGGAFSQI